MQVSINKSSEGADNHLRRRTGYAFAICAIDNLLHLNAPIGVGTVVVAVLMAMGGHAQPAQTAAPVAPSTSPVPDSSGAEPVRPAASSVASSNQVRTAPNESHTSPPEPFWLAVSRQALGTALGGLIPLYILYVLVHKHQRQNERQKLLHELAKEFQTIASTECVTGLGTNGLNNETKYRFTIALTRQVPWMHPPDVRHDFSTADRLLFFAADPNGLVSASVLHEALFWFRRIDRAHKVKLLSDADLYQMWRQVLPFVTDARYSFLKRYFGSPQQSAEDIQAARSR